jgi:hypothetical protein
MALSHEMLREELEAEERKLAKAVKEREEADRAVQALSERVAALRTLLGKNVTNAQKQEDEEATSDSGQSQRGHMRAALTEAGAKGLKPVELFKAVKKHGVKRAYVHSTLYRWKESGIVTEQNGKYSLTSVQ